VVFLTSALASAQVWDFTGNNLLNGTYVFRDVIYVPDAAANVTRAIAVFGNITFNGNGSYSISGNVADSGVGTGPFTTTGTYSIAPNGYGFMTHPYARSGGIQVLVSSGVLIGSSTENGINDVLIAVPAGSATNATFSGNYTMDYVSIAGAQVNTYGSIAQLNANGNGNIGTVPVKTYLGATNTQPVQQSEAGVTYSFASGIGTLRFPTTTNLAIQGNKEMYISADGNFIFGGSRTGWDLFVGVRRATGAPVPLDGLYYTAGINHAPVSFDTFYGALTARGTVMLEHQRFLSTTGQFPSNYTAVGVLPASATTDYTDTLSALDYTISQDGRIRVGVGQTPYMSLRIAVLGPKFTPPASTPYIDPTGIINAASFAPFTSGVAPGELVSIYGSNLAASTVVTRGGVAFPTTLGNVRVLMNNRPAALYFVSPGQIAAIVPYETTEGIVQIQVERDGTTTSNAVTMYRYVSAPGIFSQSQSGEGIGAVLHTNFSLVTEANPARPGEVVQVFLTGIGAVFPTVPTGGLGGTTTLNQTTPGTVKAFVDNLAADVSYAGLAPGLAGLYQVNVKVPDNAAAGNVFLDIATPDAYTSQVALPVGSAQAASPLSRAAEERPFVRRR
jgi:uncharacterized protein (TIGR03437 family)